MEKRAKHEKRYLRRLKSKVVVLAAVLLVTAVFVSCSSSTDEMTIFRRKIGRVNMPARQMDIYSMDTSIAQLISNEERTNIYNFSENTKIAYEATFLTVPATLVYSFEAGGILSKIEYFFDFSADSTEEEVESIYQECIKFFDYPDEGYTQGIYEYLYENPKAIWIKNNAEISLEYSLDADLAAHAVLSYYRSGYSGTSVAVFKLPFCESALGDGILSVVSSETKNNSKTTPSTVAYEYKPEDDVLLSVEYTFKGETLKKAELTLFEAGMTNRGMKNLNEEIIGFMDGQFEDAFKVDKSDQETYDLSWSGEAVDVELVSAKSSGNRETAVSVVFSDYLN